MATPQSLSFFEPATESLVQAAANNEESKSKSTKKERLGGVLRRVDRDYARALHEFTTVLDTDNGGTDFSSVVSLDKSRSKELNERWTSDEIKKLFSNDNRNWDFRLEEYLNNLWHKTLDENDENLRSRDALKPAEKTP